MTSTEFEIIPIDHWRIDWINNRRLVERAYAENPVATLREVADITGLSYWCVHFHKTQIELNWTKSDSIKSLIEKDLFVVHQWLWELINRISDPELVKRIGTKDLAQIIDICAKRYSLFKWWLTDDEWWLNYLPLNEWQEQALSILSNMFINVNINNGHTINIEEWQVIQSESIWE